MKPKVLLSYWDFRKRDMADWRRQLPDDALVFADSGAFTAHTQGADIDVGDYGRWLSANAEHFTTYANLDVIGDPVATAVNQRILEDEHGLTPLPVFHGGEPWEALDTLIADGYRYIALGGLVAVSDKVLARKFLVRCFQIGADAGVVFHGFGQTDQWMLRSLPWYSVDSTTWLNGAKYGLVYLWDDQRGRFWLPSRHDTEALRDLESIVRSHGTTVTRLAADGMTQRHALEVWRRAEAWYRRWHGPIAHPTDPTVEDGLHIYLAGSASKSIMADLVSVHKSAKHRSMS
jgi:hypothetical protein